MECGGRERYRTVDLRVSSRRAPVSQPERYDAAVTEAPDILHPLLHPVVISFQRFPRTVMEIQLPRQLHQRRSPVRRSDAAEPAPRSDHIRDARLFVGMIKLRVRSLVMQFAGCERRGGRTDVLQVLHPEIIHSEIEVGIGSYGVRIPQPAAPFPVRAVARKTVQIAGQRPDRHFMEPVHRFVGTTEITRRPHVGPDGDSPHPRGIGFGHRP